MRYVLAIASLVLSAVLLVLGIGQRTFLAGPAEISYEVDTKSETPYVVVDGEEFAKVPGQANVVVRGAGSFVATGALRDVEGWVAPYSHAALSIDARHHRLLSALVAAAVEEDETIEGETADGGAPSDATASADAGDAKPIDPRGSDLWLSERAIDDAGDGDETLRVPVSLASDQAVVIATDGGDPAPAQLSLVWAQDRQTPWAGPLLVAAGVFALLGAILYLLAVDHNRRGLGPRRGRRGPLQGIRNAFGGRGSKRTSTETAAPGPGRASRRALVPALGIAAVLGLSGCAPSYWPNLGGEAPAEETPSPQPSSIAPVPVTDGQLDRILGRVAQAAGDGDHALDASALADRFTGDALAQRTANYTIRAAMPDYAVVPPRITSEELDYQLVQSTESWPRTLLLTVASEKTDAAASDAAAGDAPTGEDAAKAGADAEEQAPASGSSPSLALILTQETPHENYEVSRVVALRGGISMPQAAPAEEGTALLANDIESLVLPPGEVASAFASVLQDGGDSARAKLFDDSIAPLLENYGKARATKAQQESDAKGQTMQYSVAVAAGEEDATALSTGVGGALVATTVMEEQAVDSAGGRYKPQAKDAVSALSGLEGEQDRLVQVVAHQLLFFVPSKNDDAKIELLGVTSELVGARN